MICSFLRMIYPKSAGDVGADGFMIASYNIHDKVPNADGGFLSQAKVVGHFLPTSTAIRYDIQGQWQKTKYGLQFEMQNYEEIIRHTREGIVGYLASGLIKGIGQKTAEKIYDAFGDTALDVLDNEPEKLLRINGISKQKLQKICESYLSYRGARDIVTALTPHGVTPNRAVRIYKQFGRDAMDVIMHHPYRLCQIPGIGFRTADAIACSMGLSLDSEERIDAGLVHTLKEAETGGSLFKNSGNLCIPRSLLLTKCLELLSTDSVSPSTVDSRIAALVANGELAVYEGQLYRAVTNASESVVAQRICGLLAEGPVSYSGDIHAETARAERRSGVTLASEQRHAVTTCLTSRVSIITGGPGTGKTMLQRVMLDVYGRLHPGATILCCAPTGRAARRMEAATGHPASTVHKALGLLADEDGQFSSPDEIDADLVLIDEVSMMDIHLAKYLLTALPRGCQLIMVGDADQLPSVGPGAVLSELIACDRIPVITLDKVYRQSSGSRIALNAALIRHGTMALEEGPDFELIESADFTESADILTDLYMKETAAHGVDNVVLLSPYRTKTPTGVNALNERLRDMVNQPDAEKPECRYGRKTFRLYDKVMQIQNSGEISNGDIGYVTGVFKNDDDTTVRVDFGDGRIVTYMQNELDKLDLAYATTVHKSQGSEYKTVLLNLQTAHYVMLKRPLLYTAITRAKERVVIVGERKALCIAIDRIDAERRGTMLAKRIQQLAPLPLQQAL